MAILLWGWEVCDEIDTEVGSLGASEVHGVGDVQVQAVGDEPQLRGGL